jgi:cell division septal protein FtsQ
VPRPQQTSLSAGRAGNRWQPVVGPQLRRRVAGRRAWRMPKLRMPTITIRWRLAAVIALMAAGLIAGGWWVYQSPLLTIRSVSVEGNSALLAEVVRNIADVKGESLIRPDFAAAEARLRAVSMIKDVKIERTFPMGARITIVERQPWGYWQAGPQRVVVDDEGVVIDLLPPQGAPVVVQTDAPAKPLALGDQVDPGAVAVAAQLATTAQQTLGRPLVAIEYSKNDGLTAVLDGGLRAVFGDAQGYDFKIATLSAILQQAGAQGQTLHRVDLRFGDRVATQ